MQTFATEVHCMFCMCALFDAWCSAAPVLRKWAPGGLNNLPPESKMRLPGVENELPGLRVPLGRQVGPRRPPRPLRNRRWEALGPLPAPLGTVVGRSWRLLGAFWRLPWAAQRASGRPLWELRLQRTLGDLENPKNASQFQCFVEHRVALCFHLVVLPCGAAGANVNSEPS